MNDQQEEFTGDDANDDVDTSESVDRKPLPAWAKLLLALLCLIAIAESFSIMMVSGTPPQTAKQQSN